MSSPNSISLLTLPAEMHLAIFEHMRVRDLHTLRLTNRYFYVLIPPPTHADLLDIERSRLARKNGFLTCPGCQKLRPKVVFSPKMYKKRRRVGQPDTRKRFCFECGRGLLPGRHRYVPGSHWWENGLPFARCLKCKNIARGHKDRTITECLSCYREQIREWRAGTELRNAHREEREEEERLQRRWAWIGRGFALSDYESSDDEDDQTDEWELRQIYNEMYF